MRAVIHLCLGLAAVFAALSPASALDINSFRAQHKLPPLKPSTPLSAAARGRAADMAQRGSLDHDGFYQRMSGYSRAAENVAYGCNDADCTYRMWVNSSGHRQNMLMSGLTHYGLGSAKAANGRRYWALELAGERPRPPRAVEPARVKPAKKRGKPAKLLGVGVWEWRVPSP
jgi:Cysteine-rich secretory protein family